MRIAFFGALIGAGLVIAAVAATPDPSEVFAQRPGPNRSISPAGELIAVSTVVDDKYQQLVVIDPKLKVMSVYHVELATGKIALRSVRNIHWDLQMTEFNSADPLPREIRSLLEPR